MSALLGRRLLQHLMLHQLQLLLLLVMRRKYLLLLLYDPLAVLDKHLGRYPADAIKQTEQML